MLDSLDEVEDACTVLSAGGTHWSTQFGKPTLPFLTLSETKRYKMV